MDDTDRPDGSLPGPRPRAALYARFSTDLQRDRSIGDQLALCRARAAALGLTVTAEYTDRALTSATMIGRDGILTLMEDARARRFDVVVVEALDRISRDQEDLSGVFKRLSFAGVAIEAVHDGRADALAVGVRGLLGTLFLQDLKHKTRRGLAGVIRDGRKPGGRAYGYRTVPGQPGVLEFEEAEADTVRRIFAEAASGKGTREIAAGLNADRVPPPRGRAWNASTLVGNRKRGYGILLNPLYRGEIVWNRVTMVRDPETGRRVNRPNAPADWHRAPAPQLRLVTDAVFQAAQRRQLAPREESWQRRRPKRVFSGLFRCGVCGGGMSIAGTTRGQVRIRCTNYTGGRSCTHARRYAVAKVERLILDHLGAALRDPAYLSAYVRAYTEERAALHRRAVADRGSLERTAARTRAARDRLVVLYARGVIDGEGAEAEIAAADRAARDAAAALAAAAPDDTVVTLHPQAVARWEALVSDLARWIAAPADGVTEALAGAVRTLIERVTVTPEDSGAGGWRIDVTGRLSAVIGDPLGLEGRVGLVVARERFAQSDLFPLLRIAV